MRVYLVRHAKAGRRASWSGDDALRPLTKAGRKQAEALADTFAELPPARLLSSPYLRCMETLQPTADRSGVKLEPSELLAEGADFEPLLELLTTLPANSVLCSHGDLIPATIAALERRGTQITTPPDWRKAAVWTLTRAAGSTIVRAAASPPPA